jgi:MoxR-like ATPase
MLLVIADGRHPSIDGIRMMAAAIRRRGRAALVEGEPGMGKSALVRRR